MDTRVKISIILKLLKLLFINKKIVPNIDLAGGCGEFNYPGVYTRVSKFLDWIQDNSKDGEC